MNWHQLEDAAQLESIKAESFEHPVLLFKHSTTCSISATALNRLERNWKQENVGTLKPYYLDLLQKRPISTQIAQSFAVEHQSPQVLIISNGECIYNESHFGISFGEIASVIANEN